MSNPTKAPSGKMTEKLSNGLSLCTTISCHGYVVTAELPRRDGREGRTVMVIVDDGGGEGNEAGGDVAVPHGPRGMIGMRRGGGVIPRPLELHVWPH